MEWFEEIVDAIESDDSTSISERPFFEVVSIIGLRYYYQKHKLKDLEPDTVYKFFMKKGYMRKMFAMKQLGPFWMEKEEFGFRGMAKAPKVPILHYRQ